MSTAEPVVADAMLHAPRLCGPRASVADVRRVLVDDHVHAALVVDQDVLLSVVLRSDLADAPAEDPARQVGTLRGRTVSPAQRLEPVRLDMVASGTRRLAVTGQEGRLLGLLCLKSSGLGFCSDEGVAERAAGRDGC